MLENYAIWRTYTHMALKFKAYVCLYTHNNTLNHGHVGSANTTLQTCFMLPCNKRICVSRQASALKRL